MTTKEAVLETMRKKRKNRKQNFTKNFMKTKQKPNLKLHNSVTVHESAVSGYVYTALCVRNLRANGDCVKSNVVCTSGG